MENHILDQLIIVGIGNPNRGDDGAGVTVADYLRARIPAAVRIFQQSGEGTDLVNLWQTINARIVYLIDAMASNLPAGAIRRFEAHKESLPADGMSNYSSHAFGLAEAIELARVLDCLPDQVIVYGIEALSFEAGAPLSVPVEAACQRVAEQIMAELARV